MAKQFNIVIPTYNESRDIKECLESISKQTYDKKNFEVIIVDNYSTDDTVKIAKSYSKRIDIKVIFNKIKDAEVSKMKGFREAKGEYFMYMDADMAFSDKQFIEKIHKNNPNLKTPVQAFLGSTYLCPGLPHPVRNRSALPAYPAVRHRQRPP